MAYHVDVGYKGCCGFLEVHNFDTGGGDVSGNTPEDLLTNLRRRYANGQLFHIWFNDETAAADADGDYDEGFCWPHVMEAVSKIPGVIDLGQHRNPNSGNNIHGYMWVNQKDE